MDTTTRYYVAKMKDAQHLAADEMEQWTIGTIPIHQQAVAWGMSNKVKLGQRADNVFHWPIRASTT